LLLLGRQSVRATPRTLLPRIFDDSGGTGILQLLVNTEYAEWFKVRVETQLNFGRSNHQNKEGDKRYKKPPSGKQTTLPPSDRQFRPSVITRVQRAWDVDRTRCGNDFLARKWREKPSVLPLPEQEAYWGPLFGQESEKDRRQWAPSCSPVLSLCSPLSVSEVERAIGTQNNGSPGDDGVRKCDLMKVGAIQLASGHTL
jgi:hypothetical protein